MEDLNEEQAELFDRQIRLYGHQSQKKMMSSNVLICELNGVHAEVC